MATPVKRVKLYPELPASHTLRVKRKGEAHTTDEKENVHKHEAGIKKQKVHVFYINGIISYDYHVTYSYIRTIHC